MKTIGKNGAKGNQIKCAKRHFLLLSPSPNHNQRNIVMLWLAVALKSYPNAQEIMFQHKHYYGCHRTIRATKISHDRHASKALTTRPQRHTFCHKTLLCFPPCICLYLKMLFMKGKYMTLRSNMNRMVIIRIIRNVFHWRSCEILVARILR